MAICGSGADSWDLGGACACRLGFRVLHGTAGEMLEGLFAAVVASSDRGKDVSRGSG